MSADEIVRALADVLVCIPVHDGYRSASASWDDGDVLVTVSLSQGAS